MKAGRQRVMHCPCGNAKVLALCLCATCYTLKRQDEEHFRGLREAVLKRDGYRCRVCDASGRDKRSIIVHHRVPGKSVLNLMISLCPGCHAKVHRTKAVLSRMPPVLLELWREQHPKGHDRRQSTFYARINLLRTITFHSTHRRKTCSRYRVIVHNHGLPLNRTLVFIKGAMRRFPMLGPGQIFPVCHSSIAMFGREASSAKTSWKLFFFLETTLGPDWRGRTRLPQGTRGRVHGAQHQEFRCRRRPHVSGALSAAVQRREHEVAGRDSGRLRR